MKKFGYILIALGFVAGALVSVLDEESIQWGYFVLSLSVGACGVGLVQFARRRRGRETDALASDLKTAEERLERIVQNLEQLNEEKSGVNTHEMRRRLDDTFSADITAFVDARESIGQAYGLDAYADVMTHFAAGERYLNRVWSASADGYVDEVNTYLERAETQFLYARNEVRELRCT